ncbi:putative aldouronate transport system substrate-binding protein [Paenibacillus cellulosilyticus]|uniref:Putative aldouronate transport system substrate-binding protein n=1 Tax=Paenibacillus cellulosilyticus TaxID=375489 RepID=A0A2V2YRX8_9BACL|nr:extracellular solute-binding protein [Paenibacillus cellulosilyticus]PWW00859.1 putative aldouronate transport system substrate-binding protein [Paenibacillus cellulosilyticus]QKS47524.1 extracellular solute-binding protein [Paenibacillus cellulosilyticus]
MKGTSLKVLTTAALSLTLLAGCGSNSDSGSTDNKASDTGTSTDTAQTQTADGPSWKIDTSPFTFSQYFYGNWASNYLWKDQYAMKLATEKTGVTIDRKLATGNDEDYLNTMIASGDLPDTIMLDWNNPAVTKLINNGMVYSMDELMDKYAPELKEMLDPDMVKYHSIDGKLWYLPNNYETADRLTSGVPITPIRPWFIRSDIYTAIGSPKIESTDDLMNALKAAKEKFPDVNPVGVEFFDVAKNGFQGSLSMDFLIDSFSPHLLEEQVKDDQQILTYPMRNKGFIDAFRYMSQLSRNGLFDPQLLIYKQEQYQEKLYGAQYAVASNYMNNIYADFNPKIESTVGADKKYQVIGGLKANGQDPRYPASRLMGWQGFFITKSAKNPERIIRWAEYAWSDEGQMDFRYGKEGETYDLVDGIPTFKPEIRDMMLKDNSGWYAKYGFQASTLMWRSGKLWDAAAARDFKEDQPEQYAAAQLLEKYNYDKYSLGMDNLEPDGSSAEGVINAKVKDLWNKTIPKLILSKDDAEFDSIYNDFVGQMDQVGAEKVEKVMYQRHLADLEKKGVK